MKRRAFSLLETVLALGLIAILMVALSTLFLRLLGGSDKSGDSSAGLQLADSILEQAIRAKDFDPPPLDGKVSLYTHDASLAQEFSYRLTSTATVVTPGKPAIYYMDVHVWWNQPRGQNRLGQGRLDVNLSRLVTP